MCILALQSRPDLFTVIGNLLNGKKLLPATGTAASKEAVSLFIPL